MGQELLLQDSLLSVSVNLGAAGATAVSSLIDLGLNAGVSSSVDQFDPQRMEFTLAAPVLSTTQLIQSSNVAYSVWMSDLATSNAASAVPVGGSGFGTASTGGIGATQYGTASSGAVAITVPFRLPIGAAKRYLWMKAVSSASTVATSAVASLALVF